VSRRVITISRKRWGKSAAKTERIIRDAVPKPEAQSGIEDYLKKAKSVTCYDLANRFNIRMSIARKILREKEVEGVVVPYIREGGFVVYTTPSELEKREGGVPIMVSDALEEVASSVPKKKMITDEMDVALAAASRPDLVKPSKLTRKRREAGAKKERKDTRPEVIIQPLETVPPQPEPELEVAKKPAKKKAAPKKKPAKKAAPKKKPAKKEAPKKKPAKKAAPKKKPVKKKAEEKAAPKKKPVKKKAEEKAAPKKKPTKKKTEEKTAPKKKATKKK
jgi:ribosomal protein S25